MWRRRPKLLTNIAGLVHRPAEERLRLAQEYIGIGLTLLELHGFKSEFEVLPNGFIIIVHEPITEQESA